MKKRLLGILLTACLLVGLLPTAALAAAPTDEGADFTADDGAAALALLNDAKTGTAESTWDSDTNTLTLKGVNFTTSAITAVKLPADTTIILADGTANTITGGDASGTGDELVPEIYGIYAEGVLTIRGEAAGTGTLTVTATGGAADYSCGIFAGSIAISGGTVTATGGAANYSYGIFADSIVISGGHVTAKAPDGFALDNEPTLPAAYWWRIKEEQDPFIASGGENGYLHDGPSYLEIRSICTVTLDRNDGGSEATPLDTGADGTIALPTPSRDGYTFDGWYTAAEGGTQVTTDTVFNANTTIYAHWTSDGGDAALTYGIGLDVSGTHTFDPADVGYGAQTSRTVTVSNTGTGATGTLSVALSGTNADAFTVSTANISSIAPGGTDSFTVVPNTGLPAGTYTATVTVDGDSVDAKSFAVSFTVNAATEYTITFDGNGGTLSATSMTTTGQKLASLPDPPRNGYIFDGWFTAVTGGDRVTAATVFNGNTTIYAHWTAVFSGGSSSGGGSSSSSSGTTTKNPDGSTTTTTTDKTTGTVTETTKNTDGSTTTVETKKDGTVTETVKTADGSSGTVVTDSSGNVAEVKASVSAAAAKEAGRTGGAVTLPVEVPSASTTKDAPAVEITLSKSSGSVKVEIPVEKATPGTVAVIVKTDGTEEIVSTSRVTENGVSLKLNGSTTVKVFDNAKSFNDVSASNVFYNEVCSLSAREIMVGKSGAKFDLYSSVTLNQIANVAGRITGAVDVKDFNSGIAWGKTNGLKSGSVSATRGDVLGALYVAAGSPTVTDTSILAQFKDPIPEDQKVIAAWAAQNGILKGNIDSKGILTANLNTNVTRGQACALAGRTLNTLG